MLGIGCSMLDTRYSAPDNKYFEEKEHCQESRIEKRASSIDTYPASCMVFKFTGLKPI